ncbi:hypothetical protein [Paramaledivibacter caminithermalis]|jgi:hypothetical protein|uniref:Uncharacterized protein n=1 Tax=Paramaledivibacter caminithermalis (strain DSM 15212 / CIP 107654 / DViRD3) TaxID=1121301 RepID=A0A1M6MKK4_PARC5|nr:hypothetical protein [Paramaledivibacter caminithermalis]SHJ83926.1 hypothetical protein SAMN02745912_01280 [Paramaledivibacter caminithermalis DSM 15212]
MNPSWAPKRVVNGTANSAIGWAFPEYVEMNRLNIWVKDANAKVYLKKPKAHFKGGTTKVFFNYCHTYETFSGSFSLGYQTGYITPQRISKEWSDQVYMTIKK